MSHQSSPLDSKPSSKLRPAFLVVWMLTIALTAALVALGTWQVQRLSDKKALIAAIETRAYGTPKPLPLDWGTIGPKSDWEYTNVTMSGTFNHDAEVQVYTVTDIGPGYWVFAPLQLIDGRNVLINRGFVTAENRRPETRLQGQIAGPVTITGLMRTTETGGLFLRENDLANQRYYRRDVAQIAAAKSIKDAAPFYVDADKTANPGGLPIGGKTQLKFPNSHLSYAITWYILAVMMLAAGWFVGRNLNSPKKVKEDI
jgi:surfeit locus 1 family protein